MLTNLQTTSRNLVLTGYVEPNKPRIGREIARQLKMPFVDVEAQIEERADDSIETIRTQFGERRLRTVEAEVMDEIALYRNAVIRVNGSTLAQEQHYNRLQQTSVIICLVARLDAILQRMHLTLGARYHDPSERAVQLGQLKREWAVRKHDGIHELDVTYRNEAGILDDILALWRELSIERG